MSTSIYYFSGTGNSLYVAKRIAEQLGECKVMNIATMVEESTIEDNNDTIGIVFPVYYWTLPTIVQDFMKKLRLDPKAYVFGIATCGGTPGLSLNALDKLLAKTGGHLSAGLTITMPSNFYADFYLGVVDMLPPLEARKQILRSSEDELAKLIDILKQREKHEVHAGFALLHRVGPHFSIPFMYDIYRLQRYFNATDKCSGCGICERVCPAGNIKRNDKKVTWGDHCTHCYACFHWCPQQAIQFGKRSTNVPRYHHPDVTVKEIMMR